MSCETRANFFCSKGRSGLPLRPWIASGRRSTGHVATVPSLTSCGSRSASTAYCAIGATSRRPAMCWPRSMAVSLKGSKPPICGRHGGPLASLHLWKPGTDIRTWLFTITHNRYIDEVSRTTRRGRNVVWEESSRTSICLPNQIEYLECLDVERAVMSLSDEQPSILLLVGLSAWNHDQIASACNLPVGTVRSRLSRGRAALRKLSASTLNSGPERERQDTDRVPEAAFPNPMRGPPTSRRFEK